MNNMKLPPGVMPQDKADNIPAKLSPGEYVIPAEVVRRKGTEFFDKLVDSGKKDLNTAAQQGRIGGTPQMPQQQQRPAPQMKPMQQGQPKPPQMQQMQQRGPMAQMQQRPAPMAQQGQPQRLPMANGGFVAGPQMAHAQRAGNQAYHAGPQVGNYANGGQVTYPQGYNPYQNPGPYQFYPYQLGPQAWGGYPGPHINPNFYDYTVRRNTQPEKEDEVEGKKAADLRPGETEDGKMVGTNTDYDVAIANMKNQGGMGDHDNPDTMDYGDIPAATAVDMAVNGFNLGNLDKHDLTDAQKEHVSNQANDKGLVGKHGQVAGAKTALSSIPTSKALISRIARSMGVPLGLPDLSMEDAGFEQTDVGWGGPADESKPGELSDDDDTDPNDGSGFASAAENIGKDSDTSQAESSQGGMGAAGSAGAGSAEGVAGAEGMGYKQGGLVVPPAVANYKK